MSHHPNNLAPIISRKFFNIFILKPKAVLWKKFDNQTYPTDAFMIGHYDKNDNDNFIGRGTYNGRRAPGRFEPETGYFVVFDSVERLVTQDVEYLSLDGSCHCDYVTCNNCDSLPNAVGFSDLQGSFYWISRETFTNECGIASPCEYSSVGQVINAQKTVTYAAGEGNVAVRFNGVYDVLVCSAYT